jgi:hypothetical protein
LYQGGDLEFLQRGRLGKLTGQKLGLHTGGKAGRTYRIKAWTSHRGEDCENKQVRAWEIPQGANLGRIPVCHSAPVAVPIAGLFVAPVDRGDDVGE